MKKYKMASLFAGIGGIDLGFENAGIKTVWANEIDTFSASTYSANHPDVKLVIDDIKNVDGKDIPKVDILAGGFPCQAFSVAGHRKGFKDERGNLFFEIIRLIEEMANNNNKPKIIFLENVKNLYNHDSGRTYKIIVKMLKDVLGYTVLTKILNSCEYGNIPQNRERIYIVAFLDKEVANRFVWPLPIPLNNTIETVVDWNMTVDKKYYYTENMKCHSLVKEGVTDSYKIYQYRRVYVRENKSNLCPTLTANMGTGGHNVPLIIDNKKRIRKLTPRECLNLQGFPNEFIIPENLTDTKIYKQAGNSVSVPVIQRIAEEIVEAITNEDN
ncbi:MAG: DNA cytosine methyltransferase [Ignavibacteriales bacterium]